MKWMLVVFAVAQTYSYAQPVGVDGQGAHANYTAGLYQSHSEECISSNDIYDQQINAPLGGHQ